MKPAAIVWSARSSMGASEDINRRLGQRVRDPPSTQLRTPKSLLLFYRFWRASDARGLARPLLYSRRFAASPTERREDDTRRAPAASACGVCLGRIAAPFEGSGGVFVPVLCFVGWEEFHTARSDGVYHWQSEWWLLNRLRNVTDLQRQRRSPCQLSHIHEPLSVGCLPIASFIRVKL